MKNQFLVLDTGTGTGGRIRTHRMMDWVMTLVNVAGSPSPVGSMMMPYPQKPKIT